jgi:cell shape-determining protein MreC
MKKKNIQIVLVIGLISVSLLTVGSITGIFNVNPFSTAKPDKRQLEEVRKAVLKVKEETEEMAKEEHLETDFQAEREKSQALSIEELKTELDRLQKDLDQGSYITQANEESLSAMDREKLAKLLTRHSALSSVLMERQLAEYEKL